LIDVPEGPNEPRYCPPDIPATNDAWKWSSVPLAKSIESPGLAWSPGVPSAATRLILCKLTFVWRV
jgi:hypothetical protein